VPSWWFIFLFYFVFVCDASQKHQNKTKKAKQQGAKRASSGRRPQTRALCH
jgi:hypothetical protein